MSVPSFVSLQHKSKAINIYHHRTISYPPQLTFCCKEENVRTMVGLISIGDNDDDLHHESSGGFQDILQKFTSDVPFEYF